MLLVSHARCQDVLLTATDEHHTESVELVDEIPAQRREAAVDPSSRLKDAGRVGENVGARVREGDV
jgi:hypothetical protein